MVFVFYFLFVYFLFISSVFLLSLPCTCSLPPCPDVLLDVASRQMKSVSGVVFMLIFSFFPIDACICKTKLKEEKKGVLEHLCPGGCRQS